LIVPISFVSFWIVFPHEQEVHNRQTKEANERIDAVSKKKDTNKITLATKRERGGERGRCAGGPEAGIISDAERIESWADETKLWTNLQITNPRTSQEK